MGRGIDGHGLSDCGGNGQSGSSEMVILARRYGWENAMAIAASRTTCWDFME